MYLEQLIHLLLKSTPNLMVCLVSRLIICMVSQRLFTFPNILISSIRKENQGLDITIKSNWTLHQGHERLGSYESNKWTSTSIKCYGMYDNLRWLLTPHLLNRVYKGLRLKFTANRVLNGILIIIFLSFCNIQSLKTIFEFYLALLRYQLLMFNILNKNKCFFLIFPLQTLKR